MFKLDQHTVAKLFENPGYAFVANTHAAVVLDDEMYIIEGDFEGLDENEFNEYIQKNFK